MYEYLSLHAVLAILKHVHVPQMCTPASSEEASLSQPGTIMLLAHK